MGVAYQVIWAVAIIVAIVCFVRQSGVSESKATKIQIGLAVFQIALCGWFFALCVSDILDIGVNFSYVRLIMNLFYGVAFLAITLYAIIYNRKNDDKYFRCVLIAYIALIAAQCFVFPYDTENEIMRIIEAVEGSVVYGVLISLLFRLDDAAYCRKALFVITLMELFIAVENVIAPFAAVIDDFQITDIPLNYASLFMRPVLLASLALLYQVRLDRKSQ